MKRLIAKINLAFSLTFDKCIIPLKRKGGKHVTIDYSAYKNDKINK